MDFWTGCTHLDHKKILKLSNRPFDTIDEMNEAIISNIAEVVKRGDTLWHLGDYCFGSYQNAAKHMKELRKCTRNIHLILGNHDKLSVTQYKEMGFCTVRNDHKMKRFITTNRPDGVPIGPRKIIMYHYPILEWDGYFRRSWHLHSHVHNTMPDDPKELRMNIGVDVHGFKPVSLDEVIEVMREREMDWDKVNHRRNAR